MSGGPRSDSEAGRLAIRRAIPEDAAAIASVLYGAFAEYEPLYTSGGFLATAISSEEVVKRMAEGPVWIALHEGEIVGTASYEHFGFRRTDEGPHDLHGTPLFTMEKRLDG